MLHFNSFWKPNWSENLISDLCYKFANLKAEIGRVCSINVSNPAGNSFFIHFLWRYQSPVVDKRISATKGIKKHSRQRKRYAERGGERESCASSRQDEKAVDLPLVGSSTATQQGLCPQLATSPRIASLCPPLLPSSKCCHVVLFLWLSCSCCRCCCCCCLLLMLSVSVAKWNHNM